MNEQKPAFFLIVWQSHTSQHSVALQMTLLEPLRTRRCPSPELEAALTEDVYFSPVCMPMEMAAASLAQPSIIRHVPTPFCLHQRKVAFLGSELLSFSPLPSPKLLVKYENSLPPAICLARSSLSAKNQQRAPKYNWKHCTALQGSHFCCTEEA